MYNMSLRRIRKKSSRLVVRYPTAGSASDWRGSSRVDVPDQGLPSPKCGRKCYQWMVGHSAAGDVPEIVEKVNIIG